MKHVAAAGLLLALGGCAAASTGARANGSITVGVTTTGAGARLLAYRVTVEPTGRTGMVEAQAGVFTVRDLPPGDYVVRLSELPADCRAENDGEARVTIAERRRAMSVRYTVACGG